MIQIDIINSLAVGVVGWEQPTRSGSPTITTANLANSSGLTFQGGHGLCTIENIKSTIDDEAITDANLNTYLSALSSRALNDVCNAVFNAAAEIVNNPVILICDVITIDIWRRI